MSARLSRRRLLVVAGGSGGAAALLAACGSGSAVDTDRFGHGDAGILNFFLALEQVETDYFEALAKIKVPSPTTSAMLAKFKEQEVEHRKVLGEELEKLGAKPVAPEAAEFSFEDEKSALEVGGEVENAVAAGYQGQLLSLKSETAIATALGIHAVEGRHACSFAYLTKKPTTPDGAFAVPADEEEALEDFL